MPLHDLGGGCFRWGDQGKRYCGPGAKKKALKQGYAEDPEHFSEIMKREHPSSKALAIEILQEESLRQLNLSLGYIPQAERDKVPDEDMAGPGRTFPIRNQQDVHNASKLIGHADNPEAVKRKIIEIAKRKNLKIPDTWSENVQSV